MAPTEQAAVDRDEAALAHRSSPGAIDGASS